MKFIKNFANAPLALMFTAFMVTGGMMLIESSAIWAETIEAASPGKTHSEDRRFVDNGDGTITDTKTNLMWMTKESYQQTGRWITWRESFDFVKKANEEGFANYYDWRMPTIEDLKTLYESGKTNSQQVGSEMKIHIDPIFAREGAGSLWALEDNGHFNAFGVEFNNGKRFSAPKKSKARKAVRPMRVIRP